MDDPDPLIATRLHQRLGSAAPLAGSRRSRPTQWGSRRVSSRADKPKPRFIEKKEKVPSAPLFPVSRGRKKIELRGFVVFFVQTIFHLVSPSVLFNTCNGVDTSVLCTIRIVHLVL